MRPPSVAHVAGWELHDLYDLYGLTRVSRVGSVRYTDPSQHSIPAYIPGILDVRHEK